MALPQRPMTHCDCQVEHTVRVLTGWLRCRLAKPTTSGVESELLQLPQDMYFEFLRKLVLSGRSDDQDQCAWKLDGPDVIRNVGERVRFHCVWKSRLLQAEYEIVVDEAEWRFGLEVYIERTGRVQVTWDGGIGCPSWGWFDRFSNWYSVGFRHDGRRLGHLRFGACELSE